MRGRYGTDQLNFFLLIVSILILLITTLLKVNYGILISVVILVFCYFRMFSKKTWKRSAENTKFLRLVYPITKRFNSVKKKWKDRKTHKYYKCPNCKQELRVPKGRGEITITCPKCHTKFDKRT